MSVVRGVAPDTAGEFPDYGARERIADACVHGLGVAAGVAGALVLLIAAGQAGGPRLLFGVLVYALGLLGMLGCSALYNLTPPSALKRRLRRLDHAAIFTMIAGSYTPFLLDRVGGALGLGLLALVWFAALGGAALAIAAPDRLRRVQVAAYLLLGWGILAAGGRLVDALARPALALLVAGGLLYSLGVVFHLWDRLRYHNAIWHAVVLIAAGCHWAAVLLGVVLA
jgi:hemolysin III